MSKLTIEKEEFCTRSAGNFDVRKSRCERPLSFCCDDKFEDVIRELVRRGWTQKPTSWPFCDLRWRNYTNTRFANARQNQILNHIENAHHLSNKGLLCLHLHNLQMNSPPGTTSFYPPTWFLSKQGVFPFLREFAICFALSNLKQWQQKSCAASHMLEDCFNLLQEVVEGHSMDREVFTDLEMNVLAFCMGSESVTNSNSLESSILTEDKLQELHCLIRAENWRLNLLEKLTDAHNMWVLKPAGSSCGRGIICSSSLPDLLQAASEVEWNCVIQKYIERPFLVNNYKFDIRLWVLIKSVDPLVVWGFNEFYLRFSSKKYSLDDPSDRFVHLCNNSVQKDSETFLEGLCEGNMWFASQFKEYIENVSGIGTFEEKVMPSLHNIVHQTLGAVKDVLVNRQDGFEWLGFDVMMAEDHAFYLLEVNLSPDVSHSTSVTSVLVPQACSGLLDLILGEQFNHQGPEGSSTPQVIEDRGDKEPLQPITLLYRWDLWIEENKPAQQTRRKTRRPLREKPAAFFPPKGILLSNKMQDEENIGFGCDIKCTHQLIALKIYSFFPLLSS